MRLWRIQSSVPAALAGGVILLLSGACAREQAVDAAPLDGSANQWKLVWSDEFNGEAGSRPDPAKWTYDTGHSYHGWGNNELENYTDSPQNIHLDGNGHLVIAALKNADGSYTSARIKTEGLFSVKYGRIEARMKLPAGPGLWPAFWLLGDDVSTVNWPACGEMDVMENVPKSLANYYMGLGPRVIQSTLHGPAPGKPYNLEGNYRFPGGSTVEQYHIYGAIWSPQTVQFYVDDPTNVFATFTSNEVTNAKGQWEFDHPYHIILNLAVGGNWPGAPDGSTSFPAEMVVDYVRVYQPGSP